MSQPLFGPTLTRSFTLHHPTAQPRMSKLYLLSESEIWVHQEQTAPSTCFCPRQHRAGVGGSFPSGSEQEWIHLKIQSAHHSLGGLIGLFMFDFPAVGTCWLRFETLIKVSVTREKYISSHQVGLSRGGTLCVIIFFREQEPLICRLRTFCSNKLLQLCS